MQRKRFINIELKDDRLQLTFDKVIEVVEKYNMIEQIAFSLLNMDIMILFVIIAMKRTIKLNLVSYIMIRVRKRSSFHIDLI